MMDPEYHDLLFQVTQLKCLKVKSVSSMDFVPELSSYEETEEPIQPRTVGYARTDMTQRYSLKVGAVDEYAPHAEMLLWFYGQFIDRFMLYEICWRLAAGHEWMQTGGRMRREFPETEIGEHWIGVHVDAVRYGPPTMPKKRGEVTIPGKPQFTVDFRLLGGPFAGLVVKQNIPYNGVVFHLAKSLGFPAFQKTHFNELVQCVFVGRLAIEGKTRKFPRIVEFFVSSGTKTFNSALRRDRAKPCPRKFVHVCHRCPVGYLGLDACKNATRPVPVIKKHCSGCDKIAMFDPLSKSETCLACEGAPFKLLEQRGT
jgi:hypothetical protein